MMRFIPLVVVALFCAFIGQSLGRTIYINHYEFEAGVSEWNAAHDRGDMAAMRVAYHKELIAHCRTFDPFWFYQPWANNCSR